MFKYSCLVFYAAFSLSLGHRGHNQQDVGVQTSMALLADGQQTGCKYMVKLQVGVKRNKMWKMESLTLHNSIQNLQKIKGYKKQLLSLAVRV